MIRNAKRNFEKRLAKGGEDEQAKKNEQVNIALIKAIKRKLHTQRLVEEEKRLTIEKILNVFFTITQEAGKKLKERERKNNEMKILKELKKEEYLKVSLTKIKHKYDKYNNKYKRNRCIPRTRLL